MTYDEAVKMIEIHGEYSKYLGDTFKMKIVPLNPQDYNKFVADILINKIYVSNLDVKAYSSDGYFAVNSFNLKVLNED